MRVKVGLVTSPVYPTPAAMPLTNWVFPAPRSPHSARISPRCKARARPRAYATVSAGWREMVVAMADGQLLLSLSAGEFADASQRKAREFLFPGSFQRAGVPRG